MQRCRWRTSLVVVGVALLVAPPTIWYISQPPAAVGDVSVADRGERLGVIDPVPALAEGSRYSWAARLVSFASPEAGGGAHAGPPTRLGIPAIAVDAPVVPVGLLADGSMEVPKDVATVGWYEPGVLPGASGSAVLAGHVDSREQGRGAFFDLGRLGVGDAITVEHQNGATTTWQVAARRSYPKDDLPIDEIFTKFSQTRLVLITCGGAFDRRTGHYTQNVVVYAHLLDADEPPPPRGLRWSRR